MCVHASVHVCLYTYYVKAKLRMWVTDTDCRWKAAAFLQLPTSFCNLLKRKLKKGEMNCLQKNGNKFGAQTACIVNWNLIRAKTKRSGNVFENCFASLSSMIISVWTRLWNCQRDWRMNELSSEMRKLDFHRAAVNSLRNYIIWCNFKAIVKLLRLSTVLAN